MSLVHCKPQKMIPKSIILFSTAEFYFFLKLKIWENMAFLADRSFILLAYARSFSRAWIVSPVAFFSPLDFFEPIDQHPDFGDAVNHTIKRKTWSGVLVIKPWRGLHWHLTTRTCICLCDFSGKVYCVGYPAMLIKSDSAQQSLPHRWRETLEHRRDH